MKNLALTIDRFENETYIHLAGKMTSLDAMDFKQPLIKLIVKCIKGSCINVCNSLFLYRHYSIKPNFFC